MTARLKKLSPLLRGRPGMVILVGTNYYLHLGKRSAEGGRTNDHVFTWAVDRYFPLIGDVPSRIGPVTVQDEYGREMSWTEFYAMISRDRSDESHIGQEFT